MQHRWININYTNIVQWARNISKGDELHQELAHYAMEQFMSNKRYDEICQKDNVEPEFGHCRAYILQIMRNAWFGKKSEFSRYHKLHRADVGTRKRAIEQDEFEKLLEARPTTEYDYNKDYIVEAIQGLIEEMIIDNKKLWYNGRLFEMWLQNPNYSALSRDTGIPRTSIATAVEEAKEWIRQQLKNRGIEYDF